jgi:hypothetical protein
MKVPQAFQRLQPLAQRLLRLSELKHYNLYQAVGWPDQLRGDGPSLSESLISLAGTDVYARLGDETRWKLGFLELINFFSMNVHGERDLIAELARRIHGPRTSGFATYLHSFIDEENKHMYLFSTFCLNYAGKIYPTKKVHFRAADDPTSDDLRFFAKVLIFEEIVDYFNVTMQNDVSLEPVVREINHIHHDDEARHIVFGRDQVEHLLVELRGRLPEDELARLRAYLSDYLRSTLRELCNPDVYREAGLPEPHAIRRMALAGLAHIETSEAATARCRRFLTDLGLLDGGVSRRE